MNKPRHRPNLRPRGRPPARRAGVPPLCRLSSWLHLGDNSAPPPAPLVHCITSGCPQQHRMLRGVIQKKETARRLKFRRYHLRAGLLTTATPFKCVVGRPLEESR